MARVKRCITCVDSSGISACISRYQVADMNVPGVKVKEKLAGAATPMRAGYKKYLKVSISPLTKEVNMATKYEIKKFIERRKNEALSKISHDREAEIASVKTKFATEHQKEMSKVKADLEAAADNFDLLCEAAAQAGITFNNKYYGNPKTYINSALSETSDYNIANYFNIPEVDCLRLRFDKLKEETEREYNRLVAVTGSMSAKEGIELLSSLGFNTSDLEAVKEVTALSVSIDINKLYLVREVK